MQEVYTAQNAKKVLASSKPSLVLNDKATINENIIATIDEQYLMIRKIGKGGTSKVYLGYDKSDRGTLYAFKVIKTPFSKVLESEHLILSQISDVNVIKSYSYSPNSKFVKSNKESTPINVSYLKLEYLPNGELFDYVFYPRKGFGENMGRLLFRTLLLSVQSLHNSGIIHRDIKSENIMLDSNFNIKLCDFGFASFNIGKFKTFFGTSGYASPEMCNKQPYYGISNDIFSLGITIFVLITGNMPFRMTNSSDPLYHLIVKNQYEEYYKKRGVKLSESFKQMFNMLIAYQPEERPSIEEIVSCKWMKEGEFTKENFDCLKKEIENRRKVILSKKSSS